MKDLSMQIRKSETTCTVS